MQRKWLRALILVAVGAVSVMATSEAEAQGPVRRLFRRMFGRDNVVAANTYTYLDANLRGNVTPPAVPDATLPAPAPIP